ncbi:MAG: acetyl-CoA carboxylase biotin carboxylase subunit, partial [bacterium]
GPGPSNQSYLQIPRIISAAEVTNSEAIHPGYGFLAENANFAEICASCHIKFIGPTPDMIEKMGDKSYAKVTMKKAGVPVVPGSESILQNKNEAKKIASEIGFPVMIKAAAGGGGRGMRIVRDETSLDAAYDMSRNEAESAFGNPDLYMEKYFENPRHIEVQILGDSHGNVIALGERECSIQRKHQKLIEESPSPAITPDIRMKMAAAAIKGAKAVNYESAGTIEFLYENGQFYFMEMNTRIQVEHPVTEAVFGTDLIKRQIEIAAGKKFEWDKNYQMRGHAIECRINAENPAQEFRPSPGKITSFHVPGGPGIRVDTHAYAHYVIPPYYDSLIAKVITHGKNRAEALVRMSRCLEEFVIEGIHTTIPFHQMVLEDRDFIEGNFDTRFVENFQRKFYSSAA